jgi:octaprenyl-diphosphate synthase
MTLPLIHTMSLASEADRRQLMAVIGNPDFGRNDFAGLVDMLERYGGIAYTREQATAHIRSAEALLHQFADCPERDILLDIAEYALVRKA